ncbi:MAG: SBBP repeat-containing protein [Candidatus Brocadiaceae bacterium]
MRMTILSSRRLGYLLFTAVVSLVFAVLTANISASEPSIDKATLSFSPLKNSSTEKDNNHEDSATRVKVQENYGKLPLYFIENQGQINEQVKFYEKGNGHTTFFTKRGICLSLANRRKIGDNSQDTKGSRHVSGRSRLPTAICPVRGDASDEACPQTIQDNRQQELVPTNSKSEIVKLRLLGAISNSEITAEELQECKVNYLIGNDPKKWKTNIPTYKSVVYKGIYKNIDMRFYGNNRQLEYDIVVNPGASPSRVQLLYDEIEDVRVTGEGDLEISLKGGKLIQKKPYVYQEIEGKRKEIEGRFVIARSGSDEAISYNPKDGIASPSARNDKSGTVGNQQFIYGFQVASYNKDYPLIIDPVLAYSTYLHGSEVDVGHGIAVDKAGNAYITGYTSSADFPLKHPIQGTYGGGYDAFVTKINSSGSDIVYSTYLGGSLYDEGNGIAVDTGGNAYITGSTRSTDFPLKSPIQGAHGGSYDDAFVTKINADGSSLVYSTYLGGSGGDLGHGIAVDTGGHAYITGQTSGDFPLKNPIQAGPGSVGYWDAFVTKINARGSRLVYSTYLGGEKHDFGFAITVDTAGNAYITGSTESVGFPLRNPIQGNMGGISDAFVTKIDAAGSSLVYSTYLGGSEGGPLQKPAYDGGYGIAVDTAENAYITGHTVSTNFPLKNPVQGANAGVIDAFVTKINASGSTLVYSTYLGGSYNEYGEGIAADKRGNAYITGWTYSTDFPLRNPIQGAKAGVFDAFVTKINAAGSSLVYSTYLGGSGGDIGFGIAADTGGNPYITGAGSTDFPLQNPIQGANAGRGDAFVTKINSGPVVITKPATKVTSASATLNGSVNPNELPTRAWFEYGTTTGKYSSKTAKWSVGSGTAFVVMKKKIGNLSSGKTYYYRAAARNSAGTVYGKRKSFRTKE